jgi:hexosaminidase
MKYRMKSKSAGILLFFLTATAFAGDTNLPSIIPLPQKIERREGVFKIRPEKRILGLHVRSGTKILTDAASLETGRYLAGQLRKSTGYQLPVGLKAGARDTKGSIILTTDNSKTILGAEGYELTVASDSVIIRASDEAGVFYGVQSLLQLLPPEVFAMKPIQGIAWNLPCVQIEDQPRFQWRGLMLDVSRHFSNKDEIKHLLDLMALHKLNTFHWHLVDDQGWRIEIKKYPRLTEIGAWRKNVGFKLDPKDTIAYGPDGRYGGFYTQADVREIVAYAQARHITIVPEIEMPGHSTAALAAYPQFSCTGGPYNTDIGAGVHNGVYCAGKNESFTFVQDVLTEVFALFPGRYIHIGGDEVPMDNWKACALCQTRMQQEGLQNEHELQGYFIRRIEKFINAHGRNLIGWSEIREGGLARNAAVMDWIGGAVEAASAGHDVVMSPMSNCYFDHYQSQDHSTEPHAIGGYLPLDKVYSFEPIPMNLPAKYRIHILGAQANLWTEYIPSIGRVEYMAFPRLSAMAEVVWSSKSSRNWDDFMLRMQTQTRRFDQLGVNYRRNTPVKVAY